MVYQWWVQLKVHLLSMIGTMVRERSLRKGLFHKSFLAQPTMRDWRSRRVVGGQVRVRLGAAVGVLVEEAGPCQLYAHRQTDTLNASTSRDTR